MSGSGNSQGMVRQLPDGPIDVVGDVHGEIEALEQLLTHLGYRGNNHPQGRHLAFVGDLVDRGADSPAVVRKVRDLIEAGTAQCILGNHEMNILRGLNKLGNAWIYGQQESLDHSSTPHPQVVATPEDAKNFIQFFKTFPLALERHDLCVVHACWDSACIELVRQETCVREAFDRHMARIDRELESRPEVDNIDRSLRRQNFNPVKVLTSGPEFRANKPFEANGKVRNNERRRWWMEYRNEAFCVFGHYWRTLVPGLSNGRHLFDDHMAEQALGPGYSMCIDYSVGGRWKERIASEYQGKFITRLAALRWPEKVLFYENGQSYDLGNIPRD
ncbi:MAG: hypothetical protein EXR99_12700 [Gemmataceae bacterium]|nr:hypothetical protein [Gemmataceae bacterium]